MKGLRNYAAYFTSKKTGLFPAQDIELAPSILFCHRQQYKRQTWRTRRLLRLHLYVQQWCFASLQQPTGNLYRLVRVPVI